MCSVRSSLGARINMATFRWNGACTSCVFHLHLPLNSPNNHMSNTQPNQMNYILVSLLALFLCLLSLSLTRFFVFISILFFLQTISFYSVSYAASAREKWMLSFAETDAHPRVACFFLVVAVRRFFSSCEICTHNSLHLAWEWHGGDLQLRWDVSYNLLKCIRFMHSKHTL